MSAISSTALLSESLEVVSTSKVGPSIPLSPWNSAEIMGSLIRGVSGPFATSTSDFTTDKM